MKEINKAKSQTKPVSWKVRKGIWLSCLIVIVLPTLLSAQPLNYTLRETIPIPSGTNVLAVGDMDGDGVLDIVLSDSSALTISVLERSDATWVNRFTISEPSQLRGAAVHEIDGDGLPEILSGNRDNGRVQIWEASEDNTYALRYTEQLGNFIENTVAGDSDGDGQREFLIARESFPSLVFILEAIADNAYMNRGSLTGLGGNNSVAGTLDLDGDGAPETVFSDDQYLLQRGNVYVYENGSLVSRGPDEEMLSFSLGDTDGNGLGEIIGAPFEQTVTTDLRILESTGTDDAFVEVFRGPNSGYKLYVLDVDQDSHAEFWRQIDDGFGRLNVFTLAHRAGDAITDIYNSGSLLQDFPDDIRDILVIGDTNNDGNLELAVVQENQIHILEPDTDELSSLSPATLWIGLKNSDAVGLRLDLLAEVFLNETKVGEGQLNNVASGSSGFNNAKLDTIPLTLFSPVGVPADAELEITLSVRRTCFGGGHNSGTPRLWFNDSQANSRFGATIDDTASELFLRDGFGLAITPGPGPKKTIDIAVTSRAPCPNRPFTPFGTWSITLP